MSKMSREQAQAFLMSQMDKNIEVGRLFNEEMVRQLMKFGIQNHMNHIWLGVFIEELGEAIQNMNNALHYTTPELKIQEHEKFKVELIQCIAVLLSWYNCIQRNDKTDELTSIINQNKLTGF